MKRAALLSILFLVLGCKPERRPFEPEFQKGVCFTHNHALNRGYGSDMARESLLEVKKLGANFVSISPIGYVFNTQDPRVFGYTGEDLTMTPERVRQTIRDAHGAGLKVLLNPHLWVGLWGSPGTWRGDIRMGSSEDWERWFENYAEFILFFAKIAHEEGVEIFSIGSELRTATELRPDLWRKLIPRVRREFDGPLTYSANWADEFDRIPFWDLLDYIGISAYFPLGDGPVDEKTAEAEKLRDRLRRFDAAWNGKPIVFLEAGFRSVEGAGSAPHEADSTGEPDPEGQAENYQIVMNTFWNEPWFYGIYWWQWFADLTYEPDPPIDYQFKNKPAEAIVHEFYARPDPRIP